MLGIWLHIKEKWMCNNEGFVHTEKENTLEIALHDL